MKNNFDKDAASEALRKRYARILDLKDLPPLAGKKKRSLWRYAACLILFAGGLFVWLSYNVPEKKVNSAVSGSNTDFNQPDTNTMDPEIYGALDVSTKQPFLPERAIVDQKTEIPDTPSSPERQEPQSPVGQKEKLGKTEPDVSSPATATYLVVLLSTKSKDEAVGRAIELNKSGNTSEVVLSSAGYYAVVFRHDTYEQAERSIKTLVASDAAGSQPYIMMASRVKASIYPEKVNGTHR